MDKEVLLDFKQAKLVKKLYMGYFLAQMEKRNPPTGEA